ncbi:DEAD/DEAH box helicase [Shewanella psychromarinicola]|uniref:Helicase n=1 Tax=Shewanella psychromarinicola TaxID=2487742 RepID=A0A3N4DD26_9GAMM|nr:DEAD/DEAH box helicase [Shewanella psychromarinicola]AZG33577.1 helicase [Shewanella psychromarinicola]MCL1082461.1 helicase [Shewanella psychromarinicola]RPA23629.1 helicase [Shewanella psychromarinicola]
MLKNIIQGIGIREVLESAIREFHETGPINMATLEKLSLIKIHYPEVFNEYEAKILSVMGLFYKIAEPKSFIESVYKNLGDTIEEQFGKPFTPMQASAYKSIVSNRFYSFSAPTSTGKSHLFRDLITEEQHDIVIIVPSRALIAEFYSLVVDLVGKEVLVLQFVENINQHHTARRIFIITPERGVELFKYADEFEVGLFLFDEAQLSEEPIRGISFDAFVRRSEKLFPKAKKVFAHPFVSNPEAQLSKHSFLENSGSNSFKQNNVGKVYLSRNEDGELEYFSPFNDSAHVKCEIDIVESTLKNDGTALIYISKSKILNGGHIEGFGKYIALCPILENPPAIKMVDELTKYIGASEGQFGKQSSFLTLMERGVVVHHGSMPLKARLLIEQFVRDGYAKICFATATLNQGINMPFDCVWIDNFHMMKELTLKNLIGRAGRTTQTPNQFDFGYTIINKANVTTFRSRIISSIELDPTSKLDDDSKDIPDDYSDLITAIKTDTFNDDLHLTDSQVDRLKESNLKSDVRFVLDKLIDGDKAIGGHQYYEIKPSIRKKLKETLKKIYITHLKRDSLTVQEQTILSASIPLLLWRVQGKAFSETLSLRHSYLTRRDERRALLKKLKQKSISQEEYNKAFDEIKIQYSARAESLPNKNARAINLFRRGAPVKEFDYDLLVYDTYDYLDKVINLSLSDPLCAALTIYYQETEDVRAKILRNFIRYGTNNEIEIWLLKYGFDPEDTEWIGLYIQHIDEQGIIFIDNLNDLSEDQLRIIERYIY